MDTLQSVIDKVRPEMSPDLAWAIIVLLSGIIVWAIVRYINKLDKILERLDTAIEGINNNLTRFGSEQQNHEKRITKLEDAKKNIRR